VSSQQAGGQILEFRYSFAYYRSGKRNEKGKKLWFGFEKAYDWPSWRMFLQNLTLHKDIEFIFL